MNIFGLPDRECRRMIMAKGVDGLETCDGGALRPLTPEDISRFPDNTA